MSAPEQSVDSLATAATAPPPNSTLPITGSQKEIGRIYTSFPKLWIGFLLAALCLVGELAGSEVLCFVVGWTGSCYWLFCIFRIHRILSEYTLKTYPVSPCKSIGFQLIPFFQFYWAFRWTKALTQFIDGQNGREKKGRVWPGLLITITSVLGYYPPFKSIRLFCLFGLGFYLAGRLEKVLPKCQPLRFRFKRAEQVNLAISTGTGAICTFLLIEAILDLFDSDAKPAQELITVVLVSLGMLLFLEPVFEWLRALFGIAEHSHASTRRPWIRLATFAVLLFTNLFHGLLDTSISSAMNDGWLAALDSLVRVLALFVVSGCITYAWIAGAHRFPSHAARSGLIAGLLATLILVVMRSSSLSLGMTTQAYAEPLSRATLAEFSKGAYSIRNEMNSELQTLNTMVFAWPLVGIVGGLAIDRKWGKRRARSVAVSVLGACLGYEIVRLTSSWSQLHPTPQLGHEILAHFSAAMGWALALIVCSSPTILAPIGAAEDEDAPEFRAKPRRSGPSFSPFRAQSAALASVPLKQSEVLSN